MISEPARWATAFHEAGHVVAAWGRGLKVHTATIVPAEDYLGKVTHVSALRGFHLDYDNSNRARLRAETAIVVLLAGPEAQRRHSPRSWRSYHGASDALFERSTLSATELKGVLTTS